LLPGLKYISILSKQAAIPLIFVFFFTSIFPVMIISADKNSRMFFHKMSRAEAKIMAVSQTDECGHYRKEMHYTFKTDDRKTYYGKWASTKDSPYWHTKDGDTVPVIYDPSDPSFNGIDGELGKNSPPFIIVFIFPLFFILICSGAFTPVLCRLKSARKIFKIGRVTKGRVVFVKRRGLSSFPYFPTPSTLQLFFEFQKENGETVEASMVTDNDWFLSKLETGDPVTVAYISGKPKNSIVVDCFFR